SGKQRNRGSQTDPHCLLRRCWFATFHSASAKVISYCIVRPLGSEEGRTSPAGTTCHSESLVQNNTETLFLFGVASSVVTLSTFTSYALYSPGMSVFQARISLPSSSVHS